MHLNTPFIQVPLDAMPIFRLAQMGQQMAQAIVTEIQRLDDLGREPAQGMVHALDIDFDCDLPVITFCENMRQPNDRCPSPNSGRVVSSGAGYAGPRFPASPSCSSAR